MKLSNFEISSSIELQSGGLFWDLHNFAIFKDSNYLRPKRRHHELDRSEGSNPWGCHENKFAGYDVTFRRFAVSYVSLAPIKPAAQ